MSGTIPLVILLNNTMNKKGFTLLEIMVVVGIIGILFSAMVSTMINSDTYWKKGINKLYQHQEARRIMDTIVKPMREASPYWSFVCDATCTTCASSNLYRLTVSNESDRVVFFKPEYNDDGSINKDEAATPTPYIFRFWSATKTLQMKIGDAEPVDIAKGIVNNTVFQGFDCDCTPMPCKDCRSVTVNVVIDNTDTTDSNRSPFTLTSHVTLRDDVIKIAIGSNVTTNSTAFEEPVEGEF
jgi:prepilin-type N-terminal cleavage/methylation domain-containing protein